MKQKIEGATKATIFKEVRLQRIFIHNSIAFYATWTTIASVTINIYFNEFQFNFALGKYSTISYLLAVIES